MDDRESSTPILEMKEKNGPQFSPTGFSPSLSESFTSPPRHKMDSPPDRSWSSLPSSPRHRGYNFDESLYSTESGEGFDQGIQMRTHDGNSVGISGGFPGGNRDQHVNQGRNPGGNYRDDEPETPGAPDSMSFISEPPSDISKGLSNFGIESGFSDFGSESMNLRFSPRLSRPRSRNPHPRSPKYQEQDDATSSSVAPGQAKPVYPNVTAGVQENDSTEQSESEEQFNHRRFSPRTPHRGTESTESVGMEIEHSEESFGEPETESPHPRLMHRLPPQARVTENRVPNYEVNSPRDYQDPQSPDWDRGVINPNVEHAQADCENRRYDPRMVGECLHYCDRAQIIYRYIEGPPGREGERGPQGEEGPQGRPGKPGRDGKNGRDGRHGIPGKDGPPGPDGPEGPRGIRGPTGPPCPYGCYYKILRLRLPTPPLCSIIVDPVSTYDDPDSYQGICSQPSTAVKRIREGGSVFLAPGQYDALMTRPSIDLNASGEVRILTLLPWQPQALSSPQLLLERLGNKPEPVEDWTSDKPCLIRRFTFVNPIRTQENLIFEECHFLAPVIVEGGQASFLRCQFNPPSGMALTYLSGEGKVQDSTFQVNHPHEGEAIVDLKNSGRTWLQRNSFEVDLRPEDEFLAFNLENGKSVITQNTVHLKGPGKKASLGKLKDQYANREALFAQNLFVADQPEAWLGKLSLEDSHLPGIFRQNDSNLPTHIKSRSSVREVENDTYVDPMDEAIVITAVEPINLYLPSLANLNGSMTLPIRAYKAMVQHKIIPSEGDTIDGGRRQHPLPGLSSMTLRSIGRNWVTFK